MSDAFDVLWLSASPSLQRFDQPLLQYLSESVRVAQWEYYQTQDEASSIDKAVDLLSEFMDKSAESVHLAGHGMGGAIALIFARRYPQKVRPISEKPRDFSRGSVKGIETRINRNYNLASSQFPR